MNDRLQNLRIAVPESRQLDVMVQLLERRGAEVFRVPLVSIHDAPDAAPVLAWIERFTQSVPDLFIILTGEGIRRLHSLAAREGVDEALISALGKTKTLCRGPKPDRALRQFGLKGTIPADAPTTEGVISTLQSMPIEGWNIAVQLYGEDPNQKLMDYLKSRQAHVDTVAPYVYADNAEESRVIELIRALDDDRMDAIVFTSQPQVIRLLRVAKKHALESSLLSGLNRGCVAAVGPVVRDLLQENGIRVDIMPPKAFFMKPLVLELMRFFNSP